LHEFGDEAQETFVLSLCVAILNHDVFPFNVTAIPQPQPECLYVRPLETGSRYKSYPGNFRRLLRVSENDRIQNRRRDDESGDRFIHVFSEA
jgi:hypothetical protein